MLMEQYAAATFKSHDDFIKNYHIRVPENYNFAFDCVDVLAQQAPHKPALVWCNSSGAQATYTFADMERQSNAAARFFASLGVKKGDRVMLLLKRRAQFWFALLGLIRLGAVAIPATHLLTPKDIAYRNNAAGVSCIVCVEEDAIVLAVEQARPHSPTVQSLVKLGGARPGWHSLDEGLLQNQAGARTPRTTQNNDTMLLYFTSGTTGMPKMVTHNFAYPLGHITTARYWQNLHPGSLHLTVADTGWAKAAWGKIFGQWLCEAAVFVYDHDRFNAKEMLAVISQFRVTSFCAPPTVYRFLIREDLTAYDLSALEYATTAGEPLNPEVFYQFQQQTGLMIRECYGQTEMTPLVITTPYTQARPGSLGKPSPAYDVLFLDEQGQPVASGQEGEICIRTRPGQIPGVFTGYYRDEALTKSVWNNGIYHTGDKVTFDEDGYVWFVGRADDIIKSSGYRIGPFEVESALLEHPAVLECAITGVPHPVRGQVVKATVVLNAGYPPTKQLELALQEHVKATTAPYKYPRVVEFVETLPKTISGKIQRVVIRDSAAKQPPASAAGA